MAFYTKFYQKNWIGFTPKIKHLTALRFIKRPGVAAAVL